MIDLLNKIEQYERELLIKKGKRESLLMRADEIKQEIQSIDKLETNLNIAINFLNKTAKDARNRTIQSIEALATMAVQAVYDEPFEIRLQYKEKTKTESSDKMTLQLVQKKNGEEVITGLMDEVGGGLIETVSFALRIACIKWLGYTGPIILDEAYKSLSKDEKIEKIAVFLGELNKTVGNQIIFSTHMQDYFGEIASKQFHVKIVNGVSIIEEC